MEQMKRRVFSISYLILSTLLVVTLLTTKTETISLNKEYIGTPIVEIDITKTKSREETWVLTAYCPCNYCSNGHNTASGEYATEGRTLAASPKYPFGTQIYIEGMGLYIVEDRFGGYVNSNRGDIFFESHEEACEFGVQQRRVIIFGTN